MMIRLPAAGFRFIRNFARSPVFLLAIFLLILLILLALRERCSILQPPELLDLSAWSLTFPVGLWLTLDVTVPRMGLESYELGYLFIRDLLVFISIPTWALLKTPGEVNIPKILGRRKPFARLVILGVFIFLSLGLLFWGWALLLPYKVRLSKLHLSPGGLLRAALACLLIPLLEEIIFRSYLYRVLREKFGFLAGLTLASTFFALLHAGSSGLLFIFIGGLLMTVLFELTGSIIPGLILHSSFNFLLSWGRIWF